jgi:hypothetical protein
VISGLFVAAYLRLLIQPTPPDFAVGAAQAETLA